MKQFVKIDQNINDSHSAAFYLDLVNCYLEFYGRRVNGGWTMSADDFVTQSYPRNAAEKRLGITLDFKKHAIIIDFD